MIPSCRVPASVALTIILASLQWTEAAAEVSAADASGFITTHSVTISRPRTEVYEAAVRQIGSWWSSDHTVSGHASNLRIDARPQGCFCERLGSSGGVVHMTVTFVNPGVMLRLTGGLGPLGLMGATGNMTWEFADVDEGTTLTWSYAVGGYLPEGPEAIARAVDRVLVEQMDSLKEFLEAKAR